MKTPLIRGLLFLLTMAVGFAAGPREAQWEKVEVARQKGLPKTALEALEPIIQGAIADRAYPEAIRAIGTKIAFEGEIQGGKAEEKIVRLQTEIAKAPEPMKPVMEAILAHWYWQYFQQNRWRFMQRTQTAAEPGPDITTWDLPRILAEIDRHFTAALASETVLKATRIRDYDDLLEPASVPDRYRPTLFDFLAYEALQFYTAGEQGGAKAEDEFEVPADSPIFARVADFMAWQPATTDEAAPALKAIRLYQKLLKFHQDDKDRSAFYDADLARLAYGGNVAVGEEKEARYQAALTDFISVTSRHEISARARAMLAELLNQNGEPAKAREIARRGLAAFEGTAGGAQCYNVIQQIEAKSAQLETEAVWNAPWPTLNLTYRNLTKVYFRAVPASFDDHVLQRRWGYGSIDGEERTKILSAAPALAWNADLPATKDYLARTERLPAPTTLKPGYYFIVASHNPDFTGEENTLNIATVWVSDLALVLRIRHDGAPQDGLVVGANGGEPVAGARVKIWERDNNGILRLLTQVETDAAGRFSFDPKNRGFVVLAEANGQSVSSVNEQRTWGNEPGNADTLTTFFTDRALYRPGQTINYKGISVRYDHKAAKYSAIAGLKLTVVFNDPNGKEIARAEHRTNDYGSFNGVFTAPRDRLMGQMTIQVLGRPSATYFSVEEYKRPKFQVEVLAPREPPKLDAPVALTGKATAYTGAAIGGAKVKWRVSRIVQFPYWCWWWRPTPSKTVAHGTATTDADGTFKVEFTVVADRTVPAKTEPVFAYEIHADVTDTTGETRSSSRTIRAGYTALQATVSAEEWQTPDKPVPFSITTSSLDGEPQAASGRILVHALRQPEKVERARLDGDTMWWWRMSARPTEPPVDPANPESWKLGDVVAEKPFQTDAEGKTQVAVTLKPGIYRAVVETKDRFGAKVTALRTLQVVDPNGKSYDVKLADHLTAPHWSLEPDGRFTALWGTGYDRGRALVEIECAGKVLQSYWTEAGRTQVLINQAVSEEMRGGFTLRTTYVRENRAYFNERVVDVPWTNKELTLKWESFRSKLVPGQKETWSALITGPDARGAATEMVAALYDASLDQFRSHHWPAAFSVFRHEYGRTNPAFQNVRLAFQSLGDGWSVSSRDVDWTYRALPFEITQELFAYRNRKRGDGDALQLSAFTVSASPAAVHVANSTLAGSRVERSAGDDMQMRGAIGGMALNADMVAADSGPPAPKPDLTQVTARKNLNETAFFFPTLHSGDDGVVRMEFTMPEALTEWKFLGFAHDAKLRAGFLTGKTVTAKDLMVEPNPPRFVREGDTIEFTVKVSNQTDQPQTGAVRLTFADAATLKSVDEALGNRGGEQPFTIPARQSRSYSWRIAVPDGLGFLTYKAVGATAKMSDGEEGFLPVLSRRILVTESLPLPIRGKTTKDFEFTKLIDSGKSTTLRSQSLTVQMVSQPAWYAVMALPYLMEYPYECSEQIFNRLYANLLARHLANSDPKIRRIFDLWKDTPALDSPLAKNQDLKSVMLEETPWLRDANKESEARRNVGLLFDANRLDRETARALDQLAQRQAENGLWPWFPGSTPNEYISLYITTGFGRLRNLGVTIDHTPAVKALDALDRWMDEHYARIMAGPSPEKYVPSSLDALYLYGRSFFLKDRAINQANQVAVDFFLKQSRKFWLQTNCRQSQAHLALALQRFGDKDTPAAIMKSLKERSVTDPELGMYWRDTEFSWWWYHAPIETQAMMIEAFDEVAHDAQAVEDCKVWLLKQKQTQDWKTTKATADAVYGLLLRGEKLLGSDALVEVSLAGQVIQPEKVEVGTGFYEQKFVRAEIKPEMGHVTVKKTDDGVSWGSVHWQYLDDMSKVTPHEGTPLKLKKTLFTKETTKQGQVLQPVNGPLAVGDELVVRIELRTDRDMEFVHLKDQRGSGTEPVNVLSRYKYQDGLGYYESTRDTASHFFIDYLPKGTYVFEYSTRVQLKGSYQTGIAEIQCMYAPEFNSHSQSLTLEVK